MKPGAPSMYSGLKETNYDEGDTFVKGCKATGSTAGCCTVVNKP